MRRLLTLLAVALAILTFSWLILGARTQRAEANNCPMQVIQLVNQMRAQHGLPPYRVNPILMAIAQAHSDYQASTHTMTHIGPGGTHPRDRARAAGYGGGATIFISENIAWGYNLTPAGAVQMWTEDQPHLNTMLGPHYRDVGAGCATAGNGAIYYTLDAAYYIGEPSGHPNGTPYPTPTVVLPVAPYIRATPRADGAIIHIVRYGQTLSGIARVYKVPLRDLLRYNHLTLKSTIYVGQPIIVRPPQKTLTPTPSPTPKSTATATPTLTPTPQPRATATSSPAPSPQRSPTPQNTKNAVAQPPTPDKKTPPSGGVILLGFFATLALIIGAYAALKWIAQFGE